MRYNQQKLQERVQGRLIVVTGGSSGIGLASAKLLARAGARTVLVARRKERLEMAQKEITDEGHEAFIYSADLTNADAVDKVVADIQQDLGTIDFLINDAGHSIRRKIEDSYDRFHDFERTMRLNYFGSLRMTLQALPGMVEQRHGHVINISSIGVLLNWPRFSAYVASKAALDAFTRCAASEFEHHSIHFTTIHMPLVRTPMIAPTKFYRKVPALSPEKAASMVARAIVHRPKRIATGLGISAQLAYFFFPKLMERALSRTFQRLPDSGKVGTGRTDQAK